MATIPEALQTAVQHHQAGRLQAAEQIYRRILDIQPNHCDVLHLLGMIQAQTGRPVEAADLIRRAIAANPNVGAYHNTLGNALQEQGQTDAAIASYRNALRIQPDDVDGHYNLGTALQERGLPAEAIASYLHVLRLRPDHAAAHYNLANAYKDQRQLAAAADHYRQVLQALPDFPEAHNNLGAVLQEQGSLDQAAIHYRQGLRLMPDCAEAHYNLGSILQEQGQLDAAQESLSRALELKPDYAQAWITRGNTFKSQGRMADAIEAYRQAVALDPSSLTARQNLLYALLFSPDYSARQIFDEHRKWNEWFSRQLPAVNLAHDNDRSPDRRLRIGYVSSDFRNHATTLFTTSLLSQHDDREFEIFCYSGVRSPDKLTELIRSYADGWRDIADLDDGQVVKLIQQDKIDLLLDLSMHMANNRISVFARKPAPVQICWVAYPGTTGLSTIDYRFTDPHIDPPNLDDQYYSEESIRLPDSFWCYSPLTDHPAVNALPAMEKGHLTFGSLNDFSKTNPQVLRLWARVMQKVPASRIVLLASEGSHRQTTVALFQEAGINAARISFVRPQPRHVYLKYYHDIDLGLDTVPYNGHTTSFDAFWMGVPVVTLQGQTVVGRAGACLLHNLGLEELIAKSEDEFVELASNLAQDLPRLSRLRAELRQRLESSPLMDAPRFARNVEAAYRELWRRWCRECGPTLRAGDFPA